MTTPLAIVCGAGIGAGIFLVILGFTTTPATVTKGTSGFRQLLRLVGLTKDGRVYADRKLILVGVAVGLIVGLFTGMYVLILAVPVAAVVLPTLLRAPPQSQDVKNVGDLTAWVRALSGNLVGGQSGLEVAIRTTLRGAPDSVRPSLTLLIARLDATQRLQDALLAWADDMNTYQGDLVAAVLIKEADRRSGGATESLAPITESLADLAKALQQIEAERSMARMTVRMVTIVTIVIPTVAAFSGYMAPYATPVGQVVFLVLFAAFIATLLAMRKVSQGKPLPRFLPADGRI
jgi:hypothetical protein